VRSVKEDEDAFINAVVLDMKISLQANAGELEGVGG
jgi:hypothetical protein